MSKRGLAPQGNTPGKPKIKRSLFPSRKSPQVPNVSSFCVYTNNCCNCDLIQ